MSGEPWRGDYLAKASPILTIGSSLNDTAFIQLGTDNYIELANGAQDSTTIDASSATFDGKTGATATLTENFAIEDKIIHKIDIASLGFIRVEVDNVFVTPSSFLIPGTTTADIQRAVDSATTGDIVHIKGGSYTGNVSSTGKAITFDIGASPAQVALNGSRPRSGPDQAGGRAAARVP